MNSPLPKVYCKRCYKTQDYRGQIDCIHCGSRFSNWHIATQLKAQRPPGMN